MENKQTGFTLVEVSAIATGIILVIFFFWGVLVAGVIKGNLWFSETGVLKELQLERSNVTKVLKVTRSVWNDSEILVLENEEQKTYYLDSDLLFNYVFSEKP